MCSANTDVRFGPIADIALLVILSAVSSALLTETISKNEMRALASTAFMYSGLGIMPLGQQLWLKELESYVTYPPLQAPESYNLTQVLQQVKSMHGSHPSD